MRRDVDVVYSQIELANEHAWSAARVDAVRQSRTQKAYVVEYSEQFGDPNAPVVAWFLYRRYSETVRLQRLVVAPEYRRRRVATCVVGWLLDRTFAQDSIDVGVPERQLDMQLFLKRMGFRCIDIRRDSDVDGGGDLYEFRRVVDSDGC